MEINKEKAEQLIIFINTERYIRRVHKSKIINSSSVIFCITVDCSFEANHLD